MIDLVKLSKKTNELSDLFYLLVDIPKDIPVSITPYIHLLEVSRFHRHKTYFFEIFKSGELKLHQNGTRLEIKNEENIREIIEKLNE